MSSSNTTNPSLPITPTQDRGISKRWQLRWAPWARLNYRRTGVLEDTYRALHRERMLRCLALGMTSQHHGICNLELDNPFIALAEYEAIIANARQSLIDWHREHRFDQRIQRSTTCQQAAKK